MIQRMKCFSLSAVVFMAAFSSLSSAQAVDKDIFSTNQICKAAVATVMGRDPIIMSIDQVQGEVVYLSYIRQDDGKKWGYKCRLEGNRIIWGAYDGRWRTHPMDSIITFQVKGDVLNIEDRFSDGSTNRKSFNLKQLGQ